jgi:hypothetical protein
LALAALGVSACGGDPTPDAATPAGERSSAQSSEAALSLTYLLKVDSPNAPFTKATYRALRQELDRAGFQLVVEETAPHDATLVLDVGAQETHSLFKVTVNGKVKRSFKVHPALSVVDGSRSIAGFSTDFESEGEVEPQHVAPLVRQLGTSTRVARLANERARQRSADLTATRKQDEDKRGQADDEEWIAAKPLACKDPARLEACDGVRLYLAHFKDGNHAVEANKLLKDAYPALEKLQKDENTWLRSSAGACDAQLTPDACDGVDIYLTKYPAGLHADEAKALLARKKKK